MATSRVGRFVMEVAPPQFVSVMRRRTPKMLDTIVEEDHRDAGNFTNENNLSSFSSSKFSSPSSSSFQMATKAKAILTSSSSSSNYFINDANSASSIYGF
ncbi:hypothetical protein C5167_009698 [Papaver somniferum]|uniref:Uncharacterized protein n=1 Tax=Papaver somniferum TaxID=3469 RepID=A0A4Y7K232_PAPSO|nr:uncharacterized protein LOC113285835 [Papaver somniferum]RZC66008.1 hypothetical protein C5167_009698 [Papaver somniferum]